MDVICLLFEYVTTNLHKFFVPLIVAFGD